LALLVSVALPPETPERAAATLGSTKQLIPPQRLQQTVRLPRAERLIPAAALMEVLAALLLQALAQQNTLVVMVANKGLALMQTMVLLAAGQRRMMLATVLLAAAAELQTIGLAAAAALARAVMALTAEQLKTARVVLAA
jgi:hypothetical protein